MIASTFDLASLLLYVFCAWGVVVALLALAARGGRDEDGPP